VDGDVGATREIDQLLVARHLGREDEALGDDDEGLVAAQGHEGLEGLAQAAEADPDPAHRDRVRLLAEERRVLRTDTHLSLAAAAGRRSRRPAGAGRAALRPGRCGAPADRHVSLHQGRLALEAGKPQLDGTDGLPPARPLR
jgi:hypothetical protein